MIDQTVLADLLDRTRALRVDFAPTAPHAWDPTTAAAELMVQIGHLARCLTPHLGVRAADFDDPERPIHDVGDELADVALAALSIAVLANAAPGAPVQVPATADDPMGALVILLGCAGQLAEAGMVTSGYRHAPTGRPPTVAQACAWTVAAADQLAEAVSVDLPTAFVAMHADATAFLHNRQSGGAS